MLGLIPERSSNFQRETLPSRTKFSIPGAASLPALRGSLPAFRLFSPLTFSQFCIKYPIFISGKISGLLRSVMGSIWSRDWSRDPDFHQGML